MATRLIKLGLPMALMVFLVAGLIISAAASHPTSPVLAQEEVPSEAEVVSQANAPVIECKWELPDMQPEVSDDTFPDGDIQYGTEANSNQHDDDMLTSPPRQCERANADETPSQVDGIPNMIQVRPLAHDDPNGPVPERFVQLWAAVDHPNGTSNISDVYWKIYEPRHDGEAGQYQFKTQVHGARVGRDSETRGRDCAALGSSNQLGTMFNAAVGTGQLSADAVDDPNFGMIAMCQQDAKSIYFAKFSIDKDQSCGQYRVDLHAVSNGAEAVRSNFIDVICYISLNMDFNSVNWGQIVPGRTKVLSGNLLFSRGDGAPTLHNGANQGLGVSIHFSEMLQVDDNGDPVDGAKTIDKFDACFGKSPSTIQCIGQPPDNPILASQVTAFDDAPERVLCANENGKLDLSIHPDASLPAGAYAGSVEVIARAVALLCPKDRDFPVPEEPVLHTLTVELAGEGSGTVTSDPEGVDCPDDCSEDYEEGTAVTLTAAADDGSQFAGWSGDCSGTDPSVQVTMDAQQSCTATFDTEPVVLQTLTVTVAGTGSGTVTSDLAGIACPDDCSEEYEEGTQVTLTAAADDGSQFAGWSGDCDGTDPSVQVTMDAQQSCTATFDTEPVVLQTLSVELAGEGSGTVTSDPEGVDCPDDCSEEYEEGTQVTLTAAADEGSQFAGWGGDCESIDDSTAQVTMDAAQSCTATFEPEGA